MATPVGWSYGPWRTQTSAQPNPYQNVPSLGSRPGPMAFDQVDSGGLGAQPSDLNTYGPMTSDERSTLSKVTGGPLGWGSLAFGYDMPDGVLGGLAKNAVNTGMRAGLTAAGIPSSPVSALSVAGTLIGLTETALNKMGVDRNRGILGLSPTQRQSLADRMGYGMSSEEGGYSPDPGTVTSNMSLGEAMGIVGGSTPDGYGGVGGYGGIGSDSSSAGASSGAEGGDTGAGGQDGEGGSGEGRGGDTDWRGGTLRGTPSSPRRSVFGAVRPETAFIVPDDWRQPGQQPREAATEAKMREILRALRG